MGKTVRTKLEEFVAELDTQKAEKVSVFYMRKALKKFFGVSERTVTPYLEDLVNFGFYKIDDPYLVRVKRKGGR